MKSSNLLLIGDSLIEFFDWQTRFAKHFVISAGVPGETVAGLLARTPHLTLQKQAPDHIIIMTGTNNLAMEDFSFILDYKQIILCLQNAFPDAEITITGLFPIQLFWLADDSVIRVNTLLEELASSRKIGYLDGCLIFSNQVTPSCFTEDGVHLSDHGYSLWSKAIEKTLQL